MKTTQIPTRIFYSKAEFISIDLNQNPKQLFENINQHFAIPPIDPQIKNYKLFLAFPADSSSPLESSLIKYFYIDNLSNTTPDGLVLDDQEKTSIYLEPIIGSKGKTYYKIANLPDVLPKIRFKAKLSSASTHAEIKDDQVELFVLLQDESKRFLRLRFPNYYSLDFDADAEILVGRSDFRRGIIPEVDLTPYLRNPLHISRLQAIIFRKQGRWFISPHPDSSSHIHINDRLMEKYRQYEIEGNTSIKFGENTLHPDLQIIASTVIQ